MEESTAAVSPTTGCEDPLKTIWTPSGHIPTHDIEALVNKYLSPLRAYLLATFPSKRDDVDDLLHDFLVSKFLKEEWLRKADRSRGRFRDFLKTSLRRFALDQIRKHAPPADDSEWEAPTMEWNESQFDLAWARTVLAVTLERMEKDCRDEGRGTRGIQCWNIFRLRLLEPILTDSPPPAYDVIIEAVGAKSSVDAQNLLATAKRIFARHLHDTVAEYEGLGQGASEDLEELKELLERLSKSENKQRWGFSRRAKAK